MKPTLSRKHHSHAIRGKLCAALALALVACGDQKGGGAAADGESADDSAAGADGGAAIDTGDPAWILPDDGGAEVVPIAPDAVAAQVEAALARISGVSAAPLLSAMDAILAAGEPGCPDWYTDEDGNPYWSDTCTASSGASFSGYGLIYRYDGYSDGATTWDGFGLAVAGSLTAPDGEELAMNGYASFLQGEEESGSLTAYSTIEAGQRWSASTEPWLAEGTGPHRGLVRGRRARRLGGRGLDHRPGRARRCLHCGHPRRGAVHHRELGLSLPPRARRRHLGADRRGPLARSGVRRARLGRGRRDRPLRRLRAGLRGGRSFGRGLRRLLCGRQPGALAPVDRPLPLSSRVEATYREG